MLTSEQMCLAIIDAYIIDRGIKPEDLTIEEAGLDPTLSVAYERLGRLTNPAHKKYAADHVGCVLTCFETDKVNKRTSHSLLTLRELMKLLDDHHASKKGKPVEAQPEPEPFPDLEEVKPASIPKKKDNPKSVPIPAKPAAIEEVL